MGQGHEVLRLTEPWQVRPPVFQKKAGNREPKRKHPAPAKRSTTRRGIDELKLEITASPLAVVLSELGRSFGDLHQIRIGHLDLLSLDRPAQHRAFQLQSRNAPRRTVRYVPDRQPSATHRPAQLKRWP